MAVAFGLSLGCLCLIVLGFGLRHKHNQQAFIIDVKRPISQRSIPWKLEGLLHDTRSSDAIFTTRNTIKIDDQIDGFAVDNIKNRRHKLSLFSLSIF
ncbi:hypothetical protein Ahy_A04g018925 isoform D [Arachis hypogaea]|uniref:Uncharacterized protein n=1 Tax=Arachis hypogaea TaxID=3818 RepID=A0A445DEY1_ARAHY|nr:hypothetical protein Ahy_A04g018925 isoform D [Arachis hypogaea]